MNVNPTVPTSMQVVTAIAWREITMAMRRRLVKSLFMINLIPPIVMAVVLIINVAAKGIGFEDLGWDPLIKLLQIQVGPVLLLALGIGTPLVARDRSEDVLFLYATRPVTPWSYTIGKMLAVAVPAVALLVLPGIIVGILRVGLIDDFSALDALLLVGKVIVVAIFTAIGFAGLTIGPSAATKKTRWALLLAFMCLAIPSAIASHVWGEGSYTLDVASASEVMIESLFSNEYPEYGFVGALVLSVWAMVGAFITSARVRKEMIP